LLPSLGTPRLDWRSRDVHVAGPLCRYVSGRLLPLGLASLPRRPLTVLVQTPRRARGLCPPPGLPHACSSRRGGAAPARVRTLCASAGRWGSPADAPCAAGHVRPPFSPLTCRPPSHSPQSPRPEPPALPTTGLPSWVPPGGVGRPLLGLGRSAPPRVVGVRWPLPLMPHGCLPMRTFWLCSPHGRLCREPRGLVLFSVVLLRGLYP
jgi:hypothetical protein